MSRQYFDYCNTGVIEIHMTAPPPYYKEICVVDINRFLNGNRVFPCGSGNDYRLSSTDITKINAMLRAYQKRC